MIGPDIEHQFAARRDPVPFVARGPDEVCANAITQLPKNFVKPALDTAWCVNIEVNDAICGDIGRAIYE